MLIRFYPFNINISSDDFASNFLSDEISLRASYIISINTKYIDPTDKHFYFKNILL